MTQFFISAIVCLIAFVFYLKGTMLIEHIMQILYDRLYKKHYVVFRPRNVDRSKLEI